jgi:hypothetical protein
MTKEIKPNGEKLLPVIPYEAYSGMSEEDLKAPIAYLRSLKAVRKETPALKTGAPFYRAGLLAFRSPWKGLWPRSSKPASRT